jgi:phosphatidate cytidylyltransferase
MGMVMVLVACGVLVVDQFLAPWYPCLFAGLLLLGGAATLELYHLLGPLPRPPLGLCLLAVCSLLAAGWPAHVGLTGAPAQPWRDVLVVLVAVVLGAFLWEMAVFRDQGGAVARVALLVWTAAYLGLLPCFFAQLRWWPAAEGGTGPDVRGVTALALVIFVPKCGDIGAYFTGRLAGRHRMTPLLSPKKTWEGLAGGLAASAAIAVGINRLMAPLLGGDAQAAAFGLVVGGAGVLGDLAESLIKRDCRQKDASRAVPGFGGVLDVVDSVLFAAPVAYWWLRG